ncbi:MAG: D-sedoheptulose 7-phosphate isomerase [Elusimicrobiota bacterium]
MKNEIEKLIRDSVAVKGKMLLENVSGIEELASRIISAYKNKKKVVVFGNGGSAADAQHLATELVCRFEKDRRSLEAVALTTNTSMITATGNDYGFEYIFSRQVESTVKEGDVVIGISTSGNSVNVLKGIEQAKKQKAVSAGWTGNTGGKLKNIVDLCICIPSDNTARIQEGHILLIHIICRLVEKELFG